MPIDFHKTIFCKIFCGRQVSHNVLDVNIWWAWPLSASFRTPAVSSLASLTSPNYVIVFYPSSILVLQSNIPLLSFGCVRTVQNSSINSYTIVPTCFCTGPRGWGGETMILVEFYPHLRIKMENVCVNLGVFRYIELRNFLF